MKVESLYWPFCHWLVSLGIISSRFIYASISYHVHFFYLFVHLLMSITVSPPTPPLESKVLGGKNSVLLVHQEQRLVTE